MDFIGKIAEHIVDRLKRREDKELRTTLRQVKEEIGYACVRLRNSDLPDIDINEEDVLNRLCGDGIIHIDEYVVLRGL